MRKCTCESPNFYGQPSFQWIVLLETKVLLRFIAYYTWNGFTETVFSSSWANDTYDVMLRPRLSSFDSAEIENEAERFEKIVKTISELLTIIFMSRTGIKYINYEKNNRNNRPCPW